MESSAAAVTVDRNQGPERSLRVAYVISTLDAGGAERQLLNLINALPARVEPAVFVLRPRLALKNELTNPRARIRVIGMRSRVDVRGWAALAWQLRRFKPDVIHSHMLLSNLAGRMFRDVARTGLLVNHEHGISTWKGRLINELDHISHRRADTIVVVSNASKQRRLQVARLDPERVIVVPNALDWHEWSSVSAAPSAGPGATWGIAARLVPIKRVELALELLAAARRQGGQQRLLIAGDGPERATLQARSAALGLGSAVTFLGEIHEMRRFYEQVDVVMLTSISEDCPMVVLEGLACGKFVVATAVGGVPELLGSLSGACLIDAEDVSGAAQRLLDVPAGYDSRENREYARRFDIRDYVNRMLAIYEGRP